MSGPRPVVAQNAREATRMLFALLVEEEVGRRQEATTRKSMRAQVRKKLVAELGLTVDKNLLVLPRASVGRQSGRFDFMRTDRNVMLTDVWAFSLELFMTRRESRLRGICAGLVCSKLRLRRGGVWTWRPVRWASTWLRQLCWRSRWCCCG